ncbi:TfoX/Sxy family protein [Microlunatus elymi]|uniref:TfoX/Sxy family protein n=1 Tax=Microlunatus elymi TaxID=2596828 RepID=A0A516Q4L5_9ACTN|nr:TfoX/Sxy family protein [Microlunatus elymi]QDP98379.1 TfoX/Sxy family protein [Microlunatus elymi]
MTAQDDLVERVRAALADHPSLREVAMFGGRSFMINDKIAVAARKGGDLLVRVAAADHAELIKRPGAGQATMGTDRTMGPGWISVEAASLDTEAELAYWLEIAVNYNRSVTDQG